MELVGRWHGRKVNVLGNAVGDAPNNALCNRAGVVAVGDDDELVEALQLVVVPELVHRVDNLGALLGRGRIEHADGTGHALECREHELHLVLQVAHRPGRVEQDAGLFFVGVDVTGRRLVGE